MATVNSVSVPHYDVKPLTKTEQEAQIMEKALAIAKKHFRKGKSFKSAELAAESLQLLYAGASREVFGIMYLDNQHKLIADEILFYGTIDGCSVYPREVLKNALKHDAAAVIIFHNHPSGVLEPSQPDLQITKRIKEALTVVDIRLLDHLIVSSEGYCSFAATGKL